MMRKLCDDFKTPLVTSPNSLCTDNAAMIAWMGHELMRCKQDVDIRDMKVDGIPKIPLGSYVRDLMLANNKQKKGGLSKQQVTMKHGSQYMNQAGESIRSDNRKVHKSFLQRRDKGPSETP